jgi:signal transduction histidine kinase
MVRRLRALRDSGSLSLPVGFARTMAAASLTMALAMSVAALVWFGFRATREWQLNAGQLVERRAAGVLALLTAGLNRDMKGAQVSVLVPITREAMRNDPPHDLRQTFARAFARFPYPESFFTWRDDGTGRGQTYFFNRADRPPAWGPGPLTRDPYPVMLVANPAASLPLIERARAQASGRRTFALIETTIDGVPYQAVIHLLYRSETDSLAGLVGFTVDMHWVRSHYFEPIVKQVARIGGEDNEMSLAVIDEAGALIASNDVAPRSDVVRDRRFPLMFFDPDLFAAMPAPRPAVAYWTARVSPAVHGALDEVADGASRTFAFISLAAVTTVVGLIATVRAVRAAAALANMQSDFVSTVTHELKTPLASIRLISDTLARGRYSAPSTIIDYARLLSDESERLRALIDNLLTFARVNHSERSYALEPIHVIDLVEDVVEHAQARLDERGFAIAIDIPHDIRVNVDRVAMMQVLANLVDNAIKYSLLSPQLTVAARIHDNQTVIEVSDRGSGIPAHEVDRVFERFFRGRDVKAGGSGLGLTIAKRVVCDHGGTIAIGSLVGAGTTVTIALPSAGRQ